MSTYSVRQFLQSRGADPSQGIRHLAPALKVIDLLSLINMERVVIHLSDLHIGKNDAETDNTYQSSMNGTAYDQSLLIINAIVSHYSMQNPKPIVVITGDLVDYGNDKYISMAQDLLGKLTSNGFTVVVNSGNHDYSDSNDITTQSWTEYLPFGIGDAIQNYMAGLAMSHFCPPEKVTGMTFVEPNRTTMDLFGFKSYGGYYLDKCGENKWSDIGAAFDLAFITVEAQDRNPNSPNMGDGGINPFTSGLPQWFFAGAHLDKKWYLSNQYLTEAHGFIDRPTFDSLQERVNLAISNGAKPIICWHYWVNYWCPRLLTATEEAIVGILNLLQGNMSQELSYIKTFPQYADSYPYLDNPNSGGNHGYDTDSLWNELENLNLQEDPSFEGSVPVPVSWNNEIKPLLDKCYMLLVGHRHIPNDLQDLRAKLMDQKMTVQSLLDVAKTEITQSETVWRQQTSGVMNDPKKSALLIQLIAATPGFILVPADPMTGTPLSVAPSIWDPWTETYEPNPNYNPLTGTTYNPWTDPDSKPPTVADYVVYILKNANLDSIDLDSCSSQQMLAYYHEAGSPLPDPTENITFLNWDGDPIDNNTFLNWDGGRPQDNNSGPRSEIKYRSWTELTISLQTGEVTLQQPKVPEDKKTPFIVWVPDYTNFIVGEQLGPLQLNAFAFDPFAFFITDKDSPDYKLPTQLNGHYDYTPPPGTVIRDYLYGELITLKVVFTPDDTANYTTASASVIALVQGP